VREQQCTRAILVGHNAHFDLGFLNAAVARAGIRRNPFHPFSCFDTVTLAGIAYGQTVLSRAAQAAGLAWDSGEAHSAAYDAERTADLFCLVCNQFQPIYEEAAQRLATEPPAEPPGEPSNPLLEPAPE
jgi:ribonuclease T